MTPLASPPIDIQEKETVYRGYFRVDKYRLRHGRFDGGWTGYMSREVLERGHAAAVLPYDPDTEQFVLCDQFRIGAHAAAMDPWQVEAVAGIIEFGETPEDVARREAEEEAGLDVRDMIFIQRYLASPGGCSESTHLYLGRISALGAGGLFGVADEGEHIRARTVPESEFRNMIESGQITNAATLIAGLWFFLNRQKIQELWKIK